MFPVKRSCSSIIIFIILLMVRTKGTASKASKKVPVKRLYVTLEMRTRPPKCSTKMWDAKSKRVKPYRCSKTKKTLSPFQLNSEQLAKVKKIKDAGEKECFFRDVFK